MEESQAGIRVSRLGRNLNILPFPEAAGAKDLILCVTKGSAYKIEDEKRHIKANVYQSWILRKGVKAIPFKLKSVGSLANDAEKPQIFIYDKKNIGTQVDLPQKIYKNLHKFILNGRPERGFCCVDFVTYLFEKYSPQFHNSLNINEWEIAPFNASQIAIGEAVLIHNNMKPFQLNENENNVKWSELKHLDVQHFAIYIGSKIYLSLFGKRGPLAFTTLTELQRFYSINSEPLKGVKLLKPL